MSRDLIAFGKGCPWVALACFAFISLAVSASAEEPFSLSVCLAAIETTDRVARGGAQDRCLQLAEVACSGPDAVSVPCLQDVAQDLGTLVKAFEPALPEPPALDELLIDGYARKLARLRGQGWSQQSCMVPMIATVSVDKRRSLCAVQRAYDRLKLAEDIARMAGITLP